MHYRSKLNLSAFTLGLTSMVGQIIIIRELIVVFYGNELSLGIILASWLFWVAFGSLVIGRFADRLKSKKNLLANIQLITALTLPLNLILIRSIKSILNIPTGQIIDFIPMLGASFISLSFICSLLGFTFVLISRLSAEKTQNPCLEIGKIYLVEGLGASIGGIIYSFFLIRALSPFENILILSGTNIAASIIVCRNILTLLYIIVLALGFVFKWPLSLEKYTRQNQFRPFELVESADSIYGNVSVTKRGPDFSFYENGFLVFTSGDLLTSEESVQYAMLEHPRPQDILLIGGGYSGSLEQILKHPVKKVDYVELDPLIIKMAQKYTPPVQDKRANIINTDGRLFVKNTGSLYDVIILNLPDPHTAMLNRFYSLEFFREIKRILAPGGVFSFSLTSSENYINHEQAYYLASIYNTLKKEFDDVKVLPGDTAHFLASETKDLLTYDPDVLIKRLRERGVNTKFVSEYYLPFRLDPMRIKYLENAILESGKAKINKDFRPIGYFYHMSLWITQFHSGKGLLGYLEKINLKFIIMVIFALFLVAVLVQWLRRKVSRAPIIISIGTTGMSEISFQIIVILAFQFLYGYVYYKIGLILTSFMIGLVLGSFFINRVLGAIKNEKALYIKTQIAICVYPLILPLIFNYISKVGPEREALARALQTSFVMLPVIAGFIGGFQFPLANKICLKSNADISKTTGLLYGIDLLGSCIGAFIIGVLLVPIIGVTQVCFLIAFINFLALALLFFQKNML
ncbi:MAG: fused MFS/spermidine synthase [Candidatus Omnitrophica bacterium]|nr:fused MFS/spermidine synthase [Candidatus Omnitrophota bacterium]MBU4149573.1 fused MFS/spermidine synthase [Candidatus Omnitrophota bacterium]